MAASAAPAPAVSNGVVKIGLLLDMTSLYADITGEGTVAAVKLAVEDFGGKVLGKPIEVVYADHFNKADVAANKAREWFDTGQVDAILDVAASAPALAVVEIAKSQNKIAVFNGPGAAALTNEKCTPVTVHYTYDTYALANGAAKAITRAGGDTWFFITADYAFGHSLEKDASDMVKASGGKVLGAVRHPLSTSDFSSFLVQAQASKAKVIALANAGADAVNTVKAASEFGLTRSQSLAGLLMGILDANALGLEAAQGMMFTEGFYWDLDDETRKWSRRFFEKMKRMPSMLHAGTYSATLTYLQAVQAARTDDADAVMKAMRAMTIDDVFARKGRIREDGRMVHDMFLVQVKKPAESKYPWDYFHVKAVIPGEEAFQPLAQGRCPLVRR
jgi:branched-chain amino acid transport system substrate-binding protein